MKILQFNEMTFLIRTIPTISTFYAFINTVH